MQQTLRNLPIRQKLVLIILLVTGGALLLASTGITLLRSGPESTLANAAIASPMVRNTPCTALASRTRGRCIAPA